MLTASTSSWVKFFTKAGIPSQAAAGYAHVFVENRFQIDMLMDDDGRLHCHPVPPEDSLQPECPRPGAVLAVGSRRGSSGFRHAEQPTQIGGVPPQLGGVSAEQIAERLFRAQNHTSGWRRIYHEHCAHRRSVA
ncbi:uncharacterized protein LOC120413603 [Culex pipiens pallens]|uniref:uncharacterized protein LOC120413603 n=1 Tax=Culex pipiens pallens TaxID=42434 RepID=UPI0022AABC46|nr:uncharacterized protein LOC120413603 [Culex pipiens pallens]